MKRQEGFTLVELLAVMAVTAIMLTIGVAAIRTFWLTRSLDGSRHQVSAQLRAVQQQAEAESRPIVLGAFFRVMTPATDTGGPQWGIVRANPGDLSWATTADNTCTVITQRRFSGGVQVATAAFSDPPTALATTTRSILVPLCKTGVAALATDFVFFFPRGTATKGCVSLNQPRLTKPNLWVSVNQLTGRVDEITATQAATTCV